MPCSGELSFVFRSKSKLSGGPGSSLPMPSLCYPLLRAHAGGDSPTTTGHDRMLAAAAGPSLIINQGENPRLPPNPSSSPRGKQVRGGNIQRPPADRGAEIRHRIERPAVRFGRALEERPIPRRIEQSNQGIRRELGDLGLEGEEGEAKEPT